MLSFSISIIIIIIFYNFSANLKNFYLEKKSQYTVDGKYLAVITKNGLWIKDEINEKIYIINSSEIKGNFLIDNFITEFNKQYEVIRNIQSNKIDVKEKFQVILVAISVSHFIQNQELKAVLSNIKDKDENLKIREAARIALTKFVI